MRLDKFTKALNKVWGDDTLDSAEIFELKELAQSIVVRSIKEYPGRINSKESLRDYVMDLKDEEVDRIMSNKKLTELQLILWAINGYGYQGDFGIESFIEEVSKLHTANGGYIVKKREVIEWLLFVAVNGEFDSLLYKAQSLSEGKLSKKVLLSAVSECWDNVA